MVKVQFLDNGLVVDVEAGTPFYEICDTYDTPVLLGCRAAACATCLIEVVSGVENLTPVTINEGVMLEILAEGNAKARLACQCSVLGPVAVRVLEG